MAILEKEVWVGLSSRTINYYENLGYDIPKRKDDSGRTGVPRGTKILVKVEDLPSGSNAKLTKICDIPNCNNQTPNQSYSDILKSRIDEVDRCFTCGNKRRTEIQNKIIFNERIGNVNKNKFGSTMTVIKYGGADDVTVEFEKGSKVHVTWDDFIKGKVRNVYDKSIFGVGYLGEGKFGTNTTDVNGKHKHTPEYKAWYDMLKRCYSKKYLEKYPTYKDVVTCDEWLNFQNFAKWYDENYYTVDEEKMELDKDIVVKGNKVYSPETSVFVPATINYLFIKCDARRGKFPIGVYQHTQTMKFVANGNNGNSKTINLGSYNTPEEAFRVYKKFKEKVIKQIAEEYKDQIPLKLYEGLIRYEVSIND